MMHDKVWLGHSQAHDAILLLTDLQQPARSAFDDELVAKLDTSVTAKRLLSSGRTLQEDQALWRLRRA